MKKYVSAFCLGIFFGMIPVSGAFADGSVKIAIVGKDNEVLENLLVPKLSVTNGIALVERQEMGRLIDEKRLGDLMAERKFSALGSLLGAEGLLVIERFRMPDGRENLTARLVSVRNGACFLFVPVPKDLPISEWVEGFSKQVALVAHMTSFPREHSLPISVVNLRSSIFSPEAAARESALTRLLELRMGGAPEIVLLDRRSLGDAAFERSLEAADLPPLWKSAVLIDGSIEEPGTTGNLKIDLRLRRQDGSVLEAFRVEGKTDGLPALADAMTAEILTKLERSSVGISPGREPQEFFDEAIWAWRSGLFDTAEKALAAADALGATSADAAALKTWLLLERSAPEGVFYGGRYFNEYPPPDARGQLALIEQAFATYADYQSLGGKLVQIRDGSAGKLQSGPLKHSLVEHGSKFLRQNDSGNAPLDASALRMLVRQTAGMEADGPRMPYSLAMSRRHACDWADNGDELLRYYEKLLRSDHKWLSSLLKYFPSTAEQGLGPRFCNDPRIVSKWESMWKRLLSDPATRLRALMILAGGAETPAQKTMYREYLVELAAQAKSLFERNQIYAFLEPDRAGRPFHMRFQPERTDLFLTLCKTLPGFTGGLYYLLCELKIPGGREQEVWESFLAYRERCMAAAGDPTQVVQQEQSFSSWSGFLLKNNPGIKSETEARSLVVHRFWHPYGQLEWKGKIFHFGNIVAMDSSVWFSGLGLERNVIMDVALSSLHLTTHEIAEARSGGQLAVTRDAIWLLNGIDPGNDRPWQSTVYRIDRHDGVLRKYPLPREGTLDIVEDRAFLRFGHQGNEGGLAELDIRSGEVRVLVSARRNPPQSPFDAKTAWRAAGVFPGPGGMLCVAVQEPEAGIFQLGNPWKKISGFHTGNILRSGSRSLLVNHRGEAMLVDPTKADVVLWMAGPKSSEAERTSARWHSLPGDTGSVCGAAAFRGDEVFALQRNGKGLHSLRWWFDGGPKEGIVIPLRFELGPDASAMLESLRKDLENNMVNLDGLKDPNRVFLPLSMLATEEGVILHHLTHGFWFIPNADLLAWREGTGK